MAFDKTLPIEGALAPTYNNIMRADKTALEAALNAYMYFATGGTQTGQPRQGQARPYFQAAAPATRLDGDYFDSTDYGTPWIASANNALYILTSANGIGTDVWTAVSTEVIAALLAATRTFAEIITFSKQPVFTIGIIDGEAYLVGRNAAGDANLNLLRTNASDLLELMDGAVLAAATETGDGDRTIADKGYVDSYIKLVDSKAAGTHGGGATSGSWAKRTVTEESDVGSHCAVSSSVIVLDAGTYQCRISAPAFLVNNHQIRLRNTTGSSTVLVGTIAYSVSGSPSQTRSEIVGIFTIAASQNLEIQHRVETSRATEGLGVGEDLGEANIYTIAEFWGR